VTSLRLPHKKYDYGLLERDTVYFGRKLYDSSSQPNKNSPEDGSKRFLQNDGSFHQNYKEWLCSGEKKTKV
jgi:hypothetical protein